MWQLVVEGALLGLDYVYHRWLEEHPLPRSGLSEMQIPRNDVGAPVPLIYGTTRVRAPILMWCGQPIIGASSDAVPVGDPPATVYGLDMFFALGIPFPIDEGGQVKVLGMWAGDRRLGWFDGAHGGAGQDGGGGTIAEAKIEISTHALEDLFIEGEAQWLDGRPTQQLVDAAGAAQNWCGKSMLDNGTPHQRIPGYRGYLSIGLMQESVRWIVGTSPSVAAYSFEARSLVNSLDATRWPATYVYASIPTADGSFDSNPMNAAYDMLCGHFGKLGLDGPSLIDMPSWQKSGHTLSQEGIGYSRCIDQTKPARDHLLEIATQIDGAFYIDPTNGKIGCQLIRDDYDPTTIAQITTANCKGLRGLAMNMWKGLPTQVRVKYTNRRNDYNDDTADSSSMAGSLGQNGEQRIEIVEMPGITTAENAKVMAEREFAARAAPIMKLTALMDRSAHRWKHGDPVRLWWNKPPINGLVFRVANIDHGTMRDGTIAVDLVQDFYYVPGNKLPGISLGGGHDIDTGLATF